MKKHLFNKKRLLYILGFFILFLGFLSAKDLLQSQEVDWISNVGFSLVLSIIFLFTSFATPFPNQRESEKK